MSCDPWPYDETCIPADWPTTGTIAGDLAAMSPAQTTAYEVAIEIMVVLAGKSLGTCTRTTRPCSRACALGYGFRLGAAGSWFTPLLYGGEVYNLCGCRSAMTCGCRDSRSAIALAGPVASVTQVRVDGVVLDPAAYTVDGDRLVRLDGGTWPVTQDLGLPATEAGTFEVIYVQGRPLSALARRALTALMIETSKAMCGDSSCKLPSRVTSIVREGVTYAMTDDPGQLLDAGRTGVPEVDLWLSTINPHGTRTRMAVYSPDLGRRR